MQHWLLPLPYLWAYSLACHFLHPDRSQQRTELALRSHLQQRRLPDGSAGRHIYRLSRILSWYSRICKVDYGSYCKSYLPDTSPSSGSGRRLSMGLAWEEPENHRSPYLFFCLFICLCLSLCHLYYFCFGSDFGAWRQGRFHPQWQRSWRHDAFGVGLFANACERWQ